MTINLTAAYVKMLYYGPDVNETNKSKINN